MQLHEWVAILFGTSNTFLFFADTMLKTTLRSQISCPKPFSDKMLLDQEECYVLGYILKHTFSLLFSLDQKRFRAEVCDYLSCLWLHSGPSSSINLSSSSS